MFCIWSSLFRLKMPVQTMWAHTSVLCQILWRRDGQKQLGLRLVRAANGCLCQAFQAYHWPSVHSFHFGVVFFEDFSGRSYRISCFCIFAGTFVLYQHLCHNFFNFHVYLNIKNIYLIIYVSKLLIFLIFILLDNFKIVKVMVHSKIKM